MGSEIDPFFQWLNVFDFNVFALGAAACPAVLGAVDQLFLRMFLPLLVLGLLLLTMGIHYSVRFIKTRRISFTPAEGEGDPIAWAYIRSITGLISFAYAVATKPVLEAFNCSRLGDQLFLVASPAISCDSAEYTKLKIIASLMVVFWVIGIPVGMSAFLFYHYKVAAKNLLFVPIGRSSRYEGEPGTPSRNSRAYTTESDFFGFGDPDSPRQVSVISGFEGVGGGSPSRDGRGASEAAEPSRIREPSRYRGASTSPGMIESREFRAKYGILTESYTPKRWWYEVVQVLRRLILIALVVSPNPRPSTYTGLAFVCLVFLAFHMRMRAFRLKFENYLENGSLLLLTIVAVLLIDVGEPPLSPFAKSLLFLLVILPTIAGLLMVAIITWTRVFHLPMPSFIGKVQDHRSKKEIEMTYGGSGESSRIIPMDDEPTTPQKP